MSTTIAINIIKNLIKKGYNIEDTLDIGLMIDIAKDVDVSHYFFKNIPLEEDTLKTLLEVRRETVANTKDYSFEKQLALDFQGNYHDYMIERVLRIIPDIFLLNDDNWLKSLINKNPIVMSFLSQKQKEHLETRDWYIKKVIELEINMSSVSEKFPWSKLETTKKVLSNSLSNLEFIPLDIIRKPEVFNHVIDILNNKKENWLNYSHKTTERILENLERLVLAFEDYQDNSQNYSEELKKQMSFENYRDHFVSAGCFHQEMSSKDLIAMLEKRLVYINNIKENELKYVNLIGILKIGIPEPVFKDLTIGFEIAGHLRKMLESKKIPLIHHRNLNSFVDSIYPYIDNNELKDILQNMKEMKYDFNLDKRTGLIYEGYFHQLVQLIEKIQVHLLEDIMLKEIPMIKKKEKSLKF